MSMITPAGRNWNGEVSRLRQAGYALPNSPTVARMEARQIVDAVGSHRGSTTDTANRKMSSDMNRRRISATRAATGGGSIRVGSDMQMAMPKIRQPLGSLVDKGIPFNTSDPKELIEIRRWARLWYSTHDLVPLLVDIYSKFPVTGLELTSKDPLIEKFYSEMFLDKLNYEEFLPDQVLREYFLAGEVTTLAHFNEELGIWSSEEVLNPDMIAVSKSLFVQEERVQLLVKDLVENLRDGPGGTTSTEESQSERLERTFEYQQLMKHYPEIVQAAARDDGLDIADALVSRLVNKVNPWDLRGTPFLLRSFRTLMMEETLNAAQDAIADRMYAPMVLATMGIENMGDGEPWIPSQGELDDLRDDMQTALAADFKLLVHNFGVQITSVFGRESVPNFDSDYDRIDAKLMQAWGIGQALIMGGTGAGGAYASSALNREVCEQLMMTAQRKVVRHMNKRMEVIAECQEHYDYELKGGRRIPLYREVVKEDPDTGEQRIVRVPKLLIPEISFSTLNLRDETQERAFIMQLKGAGVPVSDKALAINIQLDTEQELEREASETVDKGIAKSQAFKKMQDLCDLEAMPYPPELVGHLNSTLQIRQMLAQTLMLEMQVKAQKQQMDAQSPAGQAGALPPDGGGDQGDQAGPPGDTPPDGAPPGSSPPMASGPSGAPMGDPGDMQDSSPGAEPARNRTRPEESDEMRANAPRAASARWAERVGKKGQKRPPVDRKLSKFEIGPSSAGRHLHASEEQVEAAIQRREMYARSGGAPLVSQLVRDPNFYKMLHAGGQQNQIQSDYAEIRAGGAEQSARLLQELLEQYEEVTGVHPVQD